MFEPFGADIVLVHTREIPHYVGVFDGRDEQYFFVTQYSFE